MSVYPRGEIFHYDFFYKKKRYRGSTGQTTKTKAARWLEQNRESIKLGAAAGREAHTLGEAADKWFSNAVIGQKTERTSALRLKILFRHIDRDLPVTEIGPREITDAVLGRRSEPIRGSRPDKPKLPSNGTVNRDIIDMLRPILGYAETALEEPVRRIKWASMRLEEPKGRTRNFTADEIAAWRDALNEWHRPTFDFILRYGTRLGEAFFPPEAINVEACEITLYDTKNGTDHGLTIMEEDMPALAARKARAIKAGLDTIWYRDRGGGNLFPSNCKAFQVASMRAREKAGIVNAKPVHDLRHHAATTLHRQTGNLKLVQALLNHKDIASSARYAHTNKDDLRKALKQTYATFLTTSDETCERKPNRINGSGDE